MLPVAEPTSLTERNQHSKYLYNNTILQQNKAALILVVPTGYPLICHSQTECRENKVAMLFPYHLEHTMNEINNYKYLAFSKVHTKSNWRNSSAQSTNSQVCISHVFKFFLGSLCKHLAQINQFCLPLEGKDIVFYRAFKTPSLTGWWRCFRKLCQLL